MTMTIVLLFGSGLTASRNGGLPAEQSQLSRLLSDAEQPFEITAITAGALGDIPGLKNHIRVPPPGLSTVDRLLRSMGAFTLHRRFSSFPLGRLLNSIGPVDPGRVFWRSVRRDSAAMDTLKSASIAIAADMPAVKTAWIAVRRGWVDSAFYDHRAGLIDLLPYVQRSDVT